MNLRTKLLLGIGIALIITFALVAIFSLITMEESYRSLEEKEIATVVKRAQSSLTTDQKNMRSVTRDYAAWTDTYRFAQGGNPDWIELNMGNDFFKRFDLQGVLVYNSSGGLVFAKGYNASLGAVEELPQPLVSDIRNLIDSTAVYEYADGSYSIIDSTDDLFIVSSHPILTDSFEGPPTGSLHMVRRIDGQYLAELSARAGNTVEIIPSAQISGNQTTAAIVAGISPERPIVVTTESPDTIAGYTPLDNPEIPGKYYIRVSEPRTIYRSGQATIATFMIGLMIAGVFIIGFVLIIIDRIVLSRLNTIITTVRNKTDAVATNGIPDDPSIDELARLALEIDPVFERLADSRVQLQQSEERYRTLAESAQDFIYIIDIEDRVTYVNSFAAAAVRKSQDEIIGQPRSVLFPTPESERQRENIRNVIETGQPFKIESNLPLPSGELWNDTLLVPLRDRNGTITGVLGITRDITQRKRAEDALFQANKKLNLLSSITRHDILNQLTALRTYLELSLDYTKDPAMTDFIAKEKAIAEIIDQQISFTRDYQKMGMNAPTWHDVNGAVSWAIQPITDPTVKITIDCPGLEVFADPMFEKVFYNLVDNALRYGGETLSEIRIFANEDPEGLIISVEDNGAGIPYENKEQIFERGFGKNTGFGLFLSREILGITGITIQETGTFATGARFEIRVPKGAYRFGVTDKTE